MIRLVESTVDEVTSLADDVTLVRINVNGEPSEALSYNSMVEIPRLGERVLVNVTAVELDLGTGGLHFVLANLSRPEVTREGPGHIMKLRYSPLQFASLAVEEEDSPHHEALKACESLDGLPCIAFTLHSMLPCLVAGIRSELGPEARIVYVMTDEGSLPAGHSVNVRDLKRLGELQTVITAGHAFGGDHEAVTVYSALCAAKVVGNADIVLIGTGPGKVGTNTPYGCTETFQAVALNAIAALGGTAISAVRINYSDPEYRHYMLSYHHKTILGRLVCTGVDVVLPAELDPYGAVISQQAKEAIKGRNHRIVSCETDSAIEYFKGMDIVPNMMGKSLDDDPVFFRAAAAAGVHAARLCIEKDEEQE